MISCRNVDIPLRYLWFCKFWLQHTTIWTHFDRLRKIEPCSEGFMQKHWYPTEIFMYFISFDHSIPLFGLFSTSSEKWALFWRFHAETLMSCWDIYVFVSFDHSIPLFQLISTSSEKWAQFWTFHAETLILCWDIYVFVSFDRSIPLFGLNLTGSEKWALFWRFHAETLISCWDIYVFVSFDHSIPLFGLHFEPAQKKTSPVLKVLCRNVDIPLRYLCFCKFWS